MRNLFVAAVGLLAVVGCGQKPTTLSGGKPVSHWVEVLKTSPSAKARKEAAFKLGNVGPAESAALPALVGALKDADAAVRREAILAVVKFSPQAREAVPALTELRPLDRDPVVREYARKALEKLQADN
jgi:HEAT repeat protein